MFRCPGCKVKEYFAEDIVNHMNQEGHLANPFVNCPHCKNDQSMDEIAPHYKGTIPWNNVRKILEMFYPFPYACT